MKTCNKCGFQETPCYKDSQVSRRYVGTSTTSESVSLKSGQRNYVLGEIQKRIDQLEVSNKNTDAYELSGDGNQLFDQRLLQEITHPKLIGEVFSPDRFVQRSPKFGHQPGKAFNLRLGHQFLCPQQRAKCIKHVMDNPYDLFVVTPPCTMFSLLQDLGAGKSKESCMNDPEFRRRYREACMLLNFVDLHSTSSPQQVLLV